MHPLRRYLADVKETVQSFSVRVGASRQTLYRIVNGNHAPKPALARRIVEATGSAVTFDMLYRGGESGAEILDMRRRANALPSLDFERVRLSLAIVCDHLTPQDAAGPLDAALEIAAEAVVNTYLALERVTTRRGLDRLRQALRPVLEEILTEYLAFAPTPAALDQGANLATELYFRSAALDVRLPAEQ